MIIFKVKEASMILKEQFLPQGKTEGCPRHYYKSGNSNGVPSKSWPDAMTNSWERLSNEVLQNCLDRDIAMCKVGALRSAIPDQGYP